MPLPMEELAAAIKSNDAARVGRVLQLHPELKAKLNDPMPDGAFGQTALIGAVQRTNRQMIDLLLAAGADINGRSHWWAGGFGVLDDDRGLASFLIDRGATIDAHAASRLGMLDKLKELLSANPALVHARGGDGQTPLHFASTVEIAQYLLDHGADIDARDIDHESTPAQWMVRDRQEVARYLVTRGCRTDVLMAAALGDLELVRKHLDTDPACIRMNVSEQYFPKQNPRAGGCIYIWTLGHNKTAHLVAREFGQEDVFRLLMERTPEELKLAMACELGEEDLFKALLDRHPDFVKGMSDEDRRKVVDAAQNNNTQAVRLMLAAGWPADARGQHGGMPLHWAGFHRNAAMVREILRYNPPLEEPDRVHKATPLGWATHGSEHGWHRHTGDYPATVDLLCAAGAKVPDQLWEPSRSKPSCGGINGLAEMSQTCAAFGAHAALPAGSRPSTCRYET